jgi:hypothetical protein
MVGDQDLGARDRKWIHSIYSYNPNRLPLLPFATNVAKCASISYLNATPHGFEGLLPSQHWRSRHVGRSLFRVFVSDCNRSHVRQDLMGKLARVRKDGFWRPFRRLQALEPTVTFNHYLDGRIDITMFVHDARLAMLRSLHRRRVPPWES